jgi:NADPH:quinone reductase-like Zn-dependent oxidoreductase
MKAVLLMNHGGPEMLRYGDAPDPTAGPGEVVVDMHASSVNAADYKVRLGSGRSNMQFPHILGRDFSGSVRSARVSPTSPSVTQCLGLRSKASSSGAEKIAIKAAIISKKPTASAMPRQRYGADQPHRAVALRIRRSSRRETILIQGGWWCLASGSNSPSILAPR